MFVLNAEIVHFNIESYKIWMEKFYRANFPLNSLEVNITKLVSKCSGGINEELLKTAGADVLSSRTKTQKKKTSEGAGGNPPPPLLYVHGLNSNSSL